LVLFFANGVTDVYVAIRMLEAAQNNVKLIDSSFRTTLCHAMENVHERELGCMKRVEPFEALDNGMDTLSRPAKQNRMNSLES